MGWKNIMWGSDYPHYEGTYGHTQKTLHELFDDCPAEDSHRIRIGAFQELGVDGLQLRGGLRPGRALAAI